MKALLAVKMADTLAQSDYQRQEKLEYIEDIRATFLQIQADQNCLKIKDLKINGKDLIAMGLPQSNKIGIILKTLFDEVVDEPEKNHRDYLLMRARELM